VLWHDGSGLQALTHQRLGSLGLGCWVARLGFVLSITFKTEIIFGNLDDDDEGGIYFAGILRSDN